MQADASSHGIGGARAAAIAPLLVSAAKGGSGLDSGFVIPGGITLDAAALAASISTSVSCRRRVAKLYGAGLYFLCRHCYRLAYASQSEAVSDRALRRADKIRQRLGGEPGLEASLSPGPKGMWRRTHERLSEQAFQAETLADEAFAIRTERLLARIDKPKRKRGFSK
jgi:hypothetical protein